MKKNESFRMPMIMMAMIAILIGLSGQAFGQKLYNASGQPIKSSDMTIINYLPYEVTINDHPVVKCKAPVTIIKAGDSKVIQVVPVSLKYDPKSATAYPFAGLTVTYNDPLNPGKQREVLKNFIYFNQTVVIVRPEDVIKFDAKKFVVITFPEIKPSNEDNTALASAYVTVTNNTKQYIRIRTNAQAFEGVVLGPGQSSPISRKIKEGVLEFFSDIMVPGSQNTLLYTCAIKKFVGEGEAVLTVTDDDLPIVDKKIRNKIKNFDRVPIQFRAYKKDGITIDLFTLNPGESTTDAYFIQGNYKMPIIRPTIMGDNLISQNIDVVISKSGKIGFGPVGTPVRYSF